MFTELTEELLDLHASVKGGGVVPYAAVQDDTGCSCSCSIVLCCAICHICW